jgi:signal transduction histidine kinase
MATKSEYPLARLMGFTGLLEQEALPEDARKLLGYLSQSARELDDMLYKVSDLLETLRSGNLIWPTEGMSWKMRIRAIPAFKLTLP